VGVQIACQVRDYLKLGVVQNAVNLPSLTHEEYKVLAPYIDMAGRLGAFLAQAGKAGIESIDLVYGGALAEAKRSWCATRRLPPSAGIGECESHQCRGCRRRTRDPHSRGKDGHPSRRSGERADRGVAYGRGHQPRQRNGDSRRAAALLEFDSIDIETPLEGNLLVCRNFDVPGVIGKIGTILGQQGVNIANFALGRERAGAKPVKALALVQVDAPVSDTVLEALATIEALLEAKPCICRRLDFEGFAKAAGRPQRKRKPPPTSGGFSFPIEILKPC